MTTASTRLIDRYEKRPDRPRRGLGQSPVQTGDTHHQLIWLNWFGQVHLKAGGDGGGVIFDAGAGRYRYGWRIESTFPNAFDQLVTAAAGHCYVTDDDIEVPGGNDIHRLFYAAGGPHLGAFYT